MFKEKPFTLFCAFLLTLFLGTFSVTSAYAEETTDNADPFARFGNYAEGSDLAINYDSWTSLLKATVGVIRPTRRTMTKTHAQSRPGTKIPRGSTSPARYESNRVMFHKLKDEHKNVVTNFRQVLETLPNYYPLAEFNKDEQLAYWLNLHNAILYEQLIKRYPLSKLNKLRNGGKGQLSLWDEKLVTVEGVPLSLNDIQNNILIRHWKSPMVLYGLYQGAIGGPSLPDRAFTGKNVHPLLDRTARDFVNSNRGYRMRGREAQVSLLYEWGKAAFPRWERDLVRHLREYAISFSDKADLSNASGFTAKIYDWSIADAAHGTLSRAWNSVGVFNGGFLTAMWKSGMLTGDDTTRLLRSIANTRELNNRTFPREGVVISIECGTGPCPEDGPDDKDVITEPEDDKKD